MFVVVWNKTKQKAVGLMMWDQVLIKSRTEPCTRDQAPRPRPPGSPRGASSPDRRVLGGSQGEKVPWGTKCPLQIRVLPGASGWGFLGSRAPADVPGVVRCGHSGEGGPSIQYDPGPSQGREVLWEETGLGPGTERRGCRALHDGEGRTRLRWTLDLGPRPANCEGPFP